MISEVGPHYGDRRLSSQAIPLAIFLLIEEDVQESNDDHIKALFVESFGDREKFFNVCIAELEKAEEIIEKHMDRSNYVENTTDADELIEEEDDIPETQEDKIKLLLELFKEKDHLTLTKYMKIFNQGNTQILGVAHAKINAEFAKAYKKLQFAPDEDEIKHVKSFTKPNATEASGAGSMISTYCKIFHIKKFSRSFQDSLLTLFNMEPLDETEVDVEEDLALSQDFPQHSQSRTKTMKICTTCKFKSRDPMEFENHMLLHPKCPHCGLYFHDDDSLKAHDKAFHALKVCVKCGKEVLESRLKKHMNGHQLEKGYSKVVSKGKVKASKTKSTSDDPKESKPATAYRVFLKEMRPVVRNQHPDASPQEMIKLLNEAWNKEKAEGKKEVWEKKAKETPKSSDIVEPPTNNESAGEILLSEAENHTIKKCDLCGIMITNLRRHMTLAHATNAIDDELSITLIEDPPEEQEQEIVEQETVEEESTGDGAMSEGDIVLIQKKTLHWPGKVLKISTKCVQVMFFDKSRTIEDKKHNHIIPFSMDISICEGRGSVWVKAWKEAKEELEKNK